jgi:hypothetical protein
MLGLISIQENGKMQSTRNLKQPLRLFLLANACVALVTSGATLVVLLIAPLGLAAVLGCTGLVAVLSFVLGVGADLWLWHGLGPNTNRSGASAPSGWPRPEGRMGLPPGTGPDDLPTRRNP